MRLLLFALFIHLFNSFLHIFSRLNEKKDLKLNKFKGYFANFLQNCLFFHYNDYNNYNGICVRKKQKENKEKLRNRFIKIK